MGFSLRGSKEGIKGARGDQLKSEPIYVPKIIEPNDQTRTSKKNTAKKSSRNLPKITRKEGFEGEELER